MTPHRLDRLLTQLEEWKSRFERGKRSKTEKLLASLAKAQFSDASSLIRFHEILLFIRAYPASPKILRHAKRLLSSFARRVEELRSAGADLSGFEDPAVSGIAGTSISGPFSFEIVRWLVERAGSRAAIDWEGYEKTDRLGAAWPRFLPLLLEDSLVEANVPYLEWLRAAQGRSGRELRWLIRRFELLSLLDKEKAELYDSLELPVRWELGDSQSTRTRLMRSARRPFYHTSPLIRRRDVSLPALLESDPLPLQKLSRVRGERILEMAREASTVRYRELYGFTYGDPRYVFAATAGRGVGIFLSGLPPERRLPLRAYHAGSIFKNGVPVGYVETLTLFERTEVGFNLYHSFRDGESAWLYCRVLRLVRQLLGVRCFSVDPYQIGFRNEEAIESGAFWFYRKLGFRPTQAGILELAEAEEKRMAAKRGYRSPASVLRRLAEGHMLLEIPPDSRSDWDRFQVRKLGLAVQRRMAADFDGDAGRIKAASVLEVSRALGAQTADWKISERVAFESLALVLALIPGLADWGRADKQQLVRIIRAKAGAEESRYVRLLQKHPRLREAILKLGE